MCLYLYGTITIYIVVFVLIKCSKNIIEKTHSHRCPSHTYTRTLTFLLRTGLQ